MATDVRSNRKGPAAGLILGAIGVVYGDIGTSPLYAFREILNGSHTFALSEANIYGALSLVFWSLMLVVSVKYVLIVMRATNRGEGGVMALLTIVQSLALQRRWRTALISVGVMGAALFYGDALITPAISVLSAVEGLEVLSPSLADYVLPLTIVILLGLFMAQRYGTRVVGSFFGPIMTIWFLVIAGLGIHQIAKEPGVLQSLNPIYAIEFMVNNGFIAFLTLGAVVLAVTGAEALYADMGHFGASAIRRAWFFLAFPALVLNYFGQGALLIRDPSAIANPFYMLAPDWGQLPLVILATMATVIASQAVISGAFSLSRQAIRLGFLPVLEIKHTSEQSEGQIYIPAINWLLFLAVAVTILGFRTSANLSEAYGLAVTGTFITTTVLAFVYAWHTSSAPKPLMIVVGIFFAIIDLAFFTANIAKITHGGWFPLLTGIFLYLLLMTWQKGRSALRDRRLQLEGSLQTFVNHVSANPLNRVPGTAVFLSANDTTTPLALRYNVKHNKVLHEQNVVLTIEIESRPHVAEGERVSIDDLRIADDGITLVRARFGFSDHIDAVAVLNEAQSKGLDIDVDGASYFITRSTIQASGSSGLSPLSKKLFIWLNRSSASPVKNFGIPESQIVSIGSSIAI